MVKKLYKHEFLAWLRVLPIIYGITLLTAGVHRILQIFETDSVYYDIAFASATLLFVVGVLVCLAAPFVFGIVRFYKNLFTGEGYLTFTLPVKTTTHLWVKSLTTCVFCIASFFVCVCALCLICAGDLLTELWKAGAYLWALLPQKYASHMLGYFGEGCLLLLVALFSTVMLYNFCLCVGQLAKKNRILRSVGIYFAYYLLTQILGTVTVIVISVMDANSALLPYLTYFAKHPFNCMHMILWVAIGFFLLLSAAFFWVCQWILRKKLNLE